MGSQVGAADLALCHRLGTPAQGNWHLTLKNFTPLLFCYQFEVLDDIENKSSFNNLLPFIFNVRHLTYLPLRVISFSISANRPEKSS